MGIFMMIFFSQATMWKMLVDRIAARLALRDGKSKLAKHIETKTCQVFSSA